MDGGDDRPGAGHFAFSAFQLTTAAWPELADNGLSAVERVVGESRRWLSHIAVQCRETR